MYQGEFPDQGDDTLVAVSDIDAAVAMDDWQADGGPRVMAVDVARFGADSSCIAYRDGNRIERLEVIHQLDTMAVTGRVVNGAANYGAERIYVDDVGVGAGVVDRLKEQGLPVVGLNVGRPAGDRRLFANLRAEGYWELRRLLRDGGLRLPNDLRLIGELSDLKYQYNSDGRILMESKEDMKARGGSSPDVADAVMLSVLGPMTGFRFDF